MICDNSMWEPIIPTVFLCILSCPHISDFIVRWNLCLPREPTALLLSHSCGKDNVIAFCAYDPCCMHKLLEKFLFGCSWSSPLNSVIFAEDDKISWKFEWQQSCFLSFLISIFHISKKRGAAPLCRGKCISHVWTAVIANKPEVNHMNSIRVGQVYRNIFPSFIDRVISYTPHKLFSSP